MKVIIKFYQFLHLIVPAIESFPEEYYGIMFGAKTSKSSKDERFILESVFPSLTAKRKRKKVDINEDSDQKVIDLVSCLTDTRYIGDFHSHTFIHGVDSERKPRGKKDLIELLQTRAYISKDKDYNEDRKSMAKNRNFIYLLISLIKNPRFYSPEHTDDGDLFGSADGFNFLMSGFYWESRIKDFSHARIECTYLTGFKRDRGKPALHIN